MSKALETVGAEILPRQLPTDEGQAVFALMQQAIAKGGDAVASLERLVDLQERVAKSRAAREFSEALADFQANAPAIIRSVTVKIATRSGSPIEFQSFSLDDLMNAIREPLATRGMSVGFSAKVQGTTFIIVCTVRHKNGAPPIESEFPITTNNPNPGMSEQHKWIGAQTFAKRYALVNALGLTLTDPDPEAGREGSQDPTAISDEHATTLQQMLDGLVEPDRAAFWKFMSTVSGREVAKPADLREVQFAFAARTLEQKRKAGAR